MKDRYFCSPIVDEEAVKAKRERELAEEKEKVMKEYEEKKRKKKEKEEKEKEKGKDKDKDKDKDDKEDKKDDKKADENESKKVRFETFLLTRPRTVQADEMSRHPKARLLRKKSLECSSSRGWPAFPLASPPPAVRSRPLTVSVLSTSSGFKRSDRSRQRRGIANVLRSPATFHQCLRISPASDCWICMVSAPPV